MFLETGWVTLALPTLILLYYAALVFGLLLAWRFHSSRVFFALVVLMLGQQTLTLFSPGKAPHAVFDQFAVSAVAVLLPLNFVLLSLERERGFTTSGVATRTLFRFGQSSGGFHNCDLLRSGLPRRTDFYAIPPRVQ